MSFYDDGRLLKTCTWCGVVSELPLEKRLNCNTVLGEDDGRLPLGPFYVCSQGCRAFFSGEKKERKQQKSIIRWMRAYVLKTDIEVGDTVEVIADISQPGRFVEAGRGTVSARRYDFERNSAELSVRMHDGRVQKVWPAGLRTLDVENDVPPPRRLGSAPTKRAFLRVSTR
jgi:hypothetical protein